MAVTDTGALLSWGEGEGGRLGHGADLEDKWAPTVVEGVEGVVGVAAGYNVSLITATCPTPGASAVSVSRGQYTVLLSFGDGTTPAVDGEVEEEEEVDAVASFMLGLGEEVEQALVPTVIEGLVVAMAER